MISRSLLPIYLALFSHSLGAQSTYSCKEAVQKFVLINGGLDLNSADLETLTSEELQKKYWDYERYAGLLSHTDKFATLISTVQIEKGDYEGAKKSLDKIYETLRVDKAAFQYLLEKYPDLWSYRSDWESIKNIKIDDEKGRQEIKKINEIFGESPEEISRFYKKQINKNLTSNRTFIKYVPPDKEIKLYKTSKPDPNKSKKKSAIVVPMSVTLMNNPSEEIYSYGEIFQFNESENIISANNRDSIKFTTKIFDGKCYVIPTQFNLKFFSGHDVLIKNLSKESCEEILSQKKNEPVIPTALIIENDGMNEAHFKNLNKYSLIKNLCQEIHEIIAPSPQNHTEKQNAKPNTKPTSKQ